MGRAPQPPPIPPGPRPGLAWPVHVDRTGTTGPTPGAARGEMWRSTGTGLYVPSSVSAEPVDQRIVEAAATLPHDGYITGWAALRWHGATWFNGIDSRGDQLAIWVNTWLANYRDRPGIRHTEEELGHEWVTQLDGLRTTTPHWAALVEMRYSRDPDAAVIAFDMAAYADLVTLDEIRELLARLNARTGLPHARIALEHADENAWSPREVRTRLAWRRLDLPPLLTNRPVFGPDGTHLGTPDLLDPETGLMIEYDGADHLGRARRFADIRREEAFRDHGLQQLIVQADDFHAREELAARMLHAHRAARVRRRQTWTLTPPAWWIPTHTVALRRALPLQLRDRLLSYRKPA